MSEQQTHHIEEDEISLKEIILKLRVFYREALRNWKLIGLIAFPFVLFFLIRAIIVPPAYTARLTYMVNEDEGGGLGGVSTLLNQFGFAGGGSSEFNLDKIVQLSKSQKIIKEVLLEKGTVKDREDYFINHIIREYNYHKKWKKDTTGLKNYLLESNNEEQFSKTDYKALKEIYARMTGNPKKRIKGLLSSGYTDDSGILDISIQSTSEPLSIQLANTMYDKLSSFYIEKTTEKQEQTYNIVRFKADSLKQLLNQTQYEYLKFDDTNRGLALRQSQARKLKLERDMQALAIAYGEALKNVEVADFALKSATPFFQEIDEPVSPIAPVKRSKLKAILLGALLGGLLGLGLA